MSNEIIGWFLESGCEIELYDNILGLVREIELLNEVMSGIMEIIEYVKIRMRLCHRISGWSLEILR